MKGTELILATKINLHQNSMHISIRNVHKRKLKSRAIKDKTILRTPWMTLGELWTIKLSSYPCKEKKLMNFKHLCWSTKAWIPYEEIAFRIIRLIKNGLSLSLLVHESGIKVIRGHYCEGFYHTNTPVRVGLREKC